MYVADCRYENNDLQFQVRQFYPTGWLSWYNAQTGTLVERKKLAD
jgi:hypothetical protein